MGSVITTPADVVNLALQRIGYRLRVGNLYDGSDASKSALDIYGQTRDALLRDGEWGFAERNVILTLLKSAPGGGYLPPNAWSGADNPPLPYLFEYEYPDDCIKVRAVKGTPLFVPNFDPQPVVYSIANDNYYTPAKKVILCYVQGAILVYAGRVTDPSTWEASFIEALAAELGRRLAPELANLDVTKLEAGDAQVETAMAAAQQG